MSTVRASVVSTQRQATVKRIFVQSILILSILTVLAAPTALANTAGWSFTMDHRYVNGKDNGITHAMTAGNMTNDGSIWAYSKDAGATPSPNSVTVAVYRQDVFTDPKICDTTLTPYTTLHLEKSFYESCGSVQTDDYYIVAYKGADDGWNIKGDGILDT